MTAEVVSLKDARVERDERLRAYIAAACAKAGEQIEQHGEALIEWLFKSPQERAQVAAYLAGEIATRYAPIASQFKNALHDALVLYVAEAQEAREDLAMGLLRGLMLMMSDERYVEIAKHIASESIIRGMAEPAATEYRQRNPTPITAACDQLFNHYLAMRKK